MVAVGAGEADVQRVLVGADLGNVGIVQLERDADHLRRALDVAAAEHQLESSATGDMMLRAATGAQQAEDDRQGVTQRQQRLQPREQRVAANVGRLMPPVVVRGEIELADAAGDAGTTLDAHQPVIVAQVLADLARHPEQRRRGVLDLVERARERILRNVRIVAKSQQALALPLEFLYQVHLQVGAAGHVEDLEQGQEDDMVLLRAVPLHEAAQFVEQILQSQQCAYALIEGIFVGDHTAAGIGMDDF